MNIRSIVPMIRSLSIFLMCFGTLPLWTGAALALRSIVGRVIANFLFFAPQMAFAYDQVYNSAFRRTGQWVHTFPASVATAIPWILWSSVAILFVIGTRKIKKWGYLIPLALATTTLVIIASQALIYLSGNEMMLDGP